MANLSFDGILGMLFGIMSAHTLEIFEDTKVFDVALMMEIYQDPVTVTLAGLVGAGCYAATYVINQPTLGKLAAEEKLAVGGGATLIVLPILSPEIWAEVTGSMLTQVVAWMVEAGGFYALAYN